MDCNMATENHTVTSGEGALKAFERACTLSMRAMRNGEISQELYDEINHTIARLESQIKQEMEPKTLTVHITVGQVDEDGDSHTDCAGLHFGLVYTDKEGLSKETQYESFQLALIDFMAERGA